MRILVVTDRVGNAETNGSEVFCSSLLAHLREQHAVRVVGRLSDPLAEACVLENGDLGVSAAMANDSKLLMQFLRANIRPGEYDLLYNLGGLIFNCKVVTLLRVLAPAWPLVNHFQAILTEYSRLERQDLDQQNAARDSQVSCVRGAALNIFASLSEYRAALKHRFPLDRKPAAIIPNAVRVEDFEDVAPDDSFLPESIRNAETRPTILFAAGGFTDFIKGADMLYRAFAELRARGREIFLCVVSNGDRFAYLLKELPTDCFKILPWQPRAGFLSMMAASDIVVVPSRYESFGLVAAEAMLLGKPVVANAVGGLEEVVRHELTGLLNEPRGGSWGLVEALERLLASPLEAQAMGQHARGIAAADYDIARVAALVDRELRRAMRYQTAASNIEDTGVVLLA